MNLSIRINRAKVETFPNFSQCLTLFPAGVVRTEHEWELPVAWPDVGAELG